METCIDALMGNFRNKDFYLKAILKEHTDNGQNARMICISPTQRLQTSTAKAKKFQP